MSLALKTDFLHQFLLTQLKEAKSFPTQLRRSGHPMQIIQVSTECLSFILTMQFTQYRDNGESDKAMVGAVSDKFTCITCQFSAECCNEYEAYSSV
jgi:hypothetical protein